MKKLFSTVCITLCLLFSTAAVTAVRADDGNGHAPGYVCVETVDCPPTTAPPPPPSQSDSSGSSSGTTTATGDMSSIILELISALLPKI